MDIGLKTSQFKNISTDLAKLVKKIAPGLIISENTFPL